MFCLQIASPLVTCAILPQKSSSVFTGANCRQVLTSANHKQVFSGANFKLATNASGVIWWSISGSVVPLMMFYFREQSVEERNMATVRMING